MPSLSAKAQELSDVELAVLLSLASDEHCIIHSETESLGDLQDEVRLVCRASLRIIHGSLLSHFKVASTTFGLSHVTIECGTSTTVDDINAGILTKVLQRPNLATGNVCDEPAQEDVSGFTLKLSKYLICIHCSLFHHRVPVCSMLLDWKTPSWVSSTIALVQHAVVKSVVALKHYMLVRSLYNDI